MAKFNSTWFIYKRQFHSLTGVEVGTFCKLVDRLRPHWRERIEAVAARVLGVKRVVRVSREEAETLIVDCTEQPIQRAGRKQRCWYSARKNAIRLKPKSLSQRKAGSSAFPNLDPDGFMILISVGARTTVAVVVPLTCPP